MNIIAIVTIILQCSTLTKLQLTKYVEECISVRWYLELARFNIQSLTIHACMSKQSLVKSLNQKIVTGGDKLELPLYN